MGRMKPINEIRIRYEETDDGYSDLRAKINESGDLVLDGCDAGSEIERRFGDWDYEYWLTIPKEYRNTVLLHLIKDRFSSVHDLEVWLKERSIPAEFNSYC